jgi:hypothetical protein
MVWVTRFEPEVIEALATRFWDGSEERVPTTPVWKAVVHGVTLRSRYRKVEDLTRMGAMLESVEPPWRSAILDVWCDSIPARYRVTLRVNTSEHRVSRRRLPELAKTQHRAGWVALQ